MIAVYLDIYVREILKLYFQITTMGLNSLIGKEYGNDMGDN
jgi:hypothetical protein